LVEQHREPDATDRGEDEALQRGEKRDRERLGQHRPVGDQCREYEVRARQHVRRNVAPAHHHAPEHHA
jgi:hypothetical protein